MITLFDLERMLYDHIIKILPEDSDYIKNAKKLRGLTPNLLFIERDSNWQNIMINLLIILFCVISPAFLQKYNLTRDVYFSEIAYKVHFLMFEVPNAWLDQLWSYFRSFKIFRCCFDDDENGEDNVEKGEDGENAEDGPDSRKSLLQKTVDKVKDVLPGKNVPADKNMSYKNSIYESSESVSEDSREFFDNYRQRSNRQERLYKTGKADFREFYRKELHHKKKNKRSYKTTADDKKKSKDNEGRMRVYLSYFLSKIKYILLALVFITGIRGDRTRPNPDS